jgi:WD40 repeat protein
MRIGFLTKRVIFFAFSLLLGLTTLEAAFIAPELKYQTIETEHFQVHFPEERGKEGERIATMAEELYMLLGQEFNVYPKGRVQIVLKDQDDDANGFATVLPYNLIYLRLIPPDADSSLDHYDDWLRMLLVHEYTHVLNLSDAGYPAKLLKFVLGKIVAPNAVAPLWITEGMASYFETKFTEGGRGDSSFTEMMLRTDILNDEFLKIDQASGNMYDWPSYQAAYLYGVAFWKYLAETYGHEKVAEFSNQYGASLWLFAINNKAKRVFGKSFYKLWQEWKEALQNKYEAQASVLNEQGLKAGEIILDAPQGRFFRPTWNPDGTCLVYSAASVHHKTEVRKRCGAEDELLFDTSATAALSYSTFDRYTPSKFSWSPDGKQIAFTSIRRKKRHYGFQDLFVYDLEKKTSNALINKEEVYTKDGQLTVIKGLRVRDPSFSPDGKKIALSLHTQGRDVLVVFNQDDKKLTLLNDTSDKTRIDQLVWSPDGLLIAASARLAGGARNIVLFDLEGGIQSITDDRGSNLQAAFSPDGAHLYFVSDRSGISNIYRFNLKDKTTEQITRVLSGAFNPTISARDGSLTYQYYTGVGFSLRSVSTEPVKNMGFGSREPGAEPNQLEDKSQLRDPEQQIQLPEAHPYSPLGTFLLPHYLQPGLLFLDNSILVSAFIGSSDPLFRHHWSALADYRSDADFFGFAAGYTYSRFDPIFNINIARYAVNFGNLFGTNSSFFEERRRASAGVSFPYKGKHFLSAGYFFEDRSAESAIPNNPIVTPVLGNFAGIRLSYSQGKVDFFPASISRENGFTFRSNLDLTNSILGASENLEQLLLSADARQFVSMPWSRHHVLAFRQAGGFAYGDKLTQGTFGLGGSLGESFLTGTSTRNFTLRGLPLTTFLRDRTMVLSAEYRMPLFSAQRGLGTWPFFLRQASVAFFADYGNAWNDTPAIENFFDDFLLGVGVELRGDFVLMHHVPILGRLGYGMIVTNRSRVASLSDPIIGQKISKGILILEFGTSF